MYKLNHKKKLHEGIIQKCVWDHTPDRCGTCHRMKSYYTTLQRVVGMSSCSVLYSSEVDVVQRQSTKNGF